MIPEAAVEAAARFMHDEEGYFELFEDAPDFRKEHFREKAKAILEAAARHMKADAWDEGCEAMHATTGGEWPPIHEDNPYRSQT